MACTCILIMHIYILRFRIHSHYLYLYVVWLVCLVFTFIIHFFATHEYMNACHMRMKSTLIFFIELIWSSNRRLASTIKNSWGLWHTYWQQRTLLHCLILYCVMMQWRQKMNFKSLYMINEHLENVLIMSEYKMSRNFYTRHTLLPLS